jgi:uncharacterized membrane protein (UPF0127 family)
MLQSEISGQNYASRIEVFQTSKDRTTGLLKFKEPPHDYAAIFELPLNGFLPMVHTFGMKFPIHILFCDRNGEVKEIYTNIQPGVFVLPWRAVLGGRPYLLELSHPTAIPPLGDKLNWRGL